MFRYLRTIIRTSPRIVAFAALTGALAALASPMAVLAAPEPALIPVRWELDFKPGPLRVATVEVETNAPGPNGTVAVVRQPRSYFYLTYMVVNNSDEDLTFAPSFEMATDAGGEVVRAGRNVPLEVTRTIMERLRNPLLHDPISMIGALGQGQENAREGVVIWEATNLKIDEVVIFGAGFSGESRRVTPPGSNEEMVLRKTVMLRYVTPGDLAGFYDQPIPLEEERWILR